MKAKRVTAGRNRTFEFDRERFKTLVRYVIWRAGRKPGLSAAGLGQVLWLAEARAYVMRGRPITGAVFVRREDGPFTEALAPIREELEREAPAASRIGPDMSGFDSRDIREIDDCIRASGSAGAHEAWQIAEIGEELPYAAILAERMRRPTDDEAEWARRRARELDLS